MAGFLEGDRPDLGIDDLKGQPVPAISLHDVRLRNLGVAPGTAIVVVSLADSAGTQLLTFPLRRGSRVRIPARALGGALGRVEPLTAPPPFDDLVANLLRTRSRFYLTVRVTTDGGDQNVADNVRTREFGVGAWARLTPGVTTIAAFGFAVATATSATARVESTWLPPGASLLRDSNQSMRFVGTGKHSMAIRLVSTDWLPHGSIFAARFLLSDSATGRVLNQREQIGIFDTIPPFIGSYQAIAFRDGRVAIEVKAGDRHSGVPENGVTTEYSTDDGRTWTQKVHDFVYDDFGRPLLFQVVLGPFPLGTKLLVGVRAVDQVGNATVDLPTDATLLAAPINAERALESFRYVREDGNPLFAAPTLLRRAQFLDTLAPVLDATLRVERTSSVAAIERFEARRRHELGDVLRQLRDLRIDLSQFRRITVDRVSLKSGGASARPIIKLSQ